METKFLIQNNDDAIIPEETDEVFKGETRKGNFKELSLSFAFTNVLYSESPPSLRYKFHFILAIMIGLGAGLAGVLILVIALIICICMKNRNQEKAITPLNVVSNKGVVCSLRECQWI